MLKKFSFAATLFFLLLAFTIQAHAAPPVLDAFAARLQFARQQLPATQKVAQAVADRVFANPTALLDVPYSPQPGFAEEILNRAGGLANTLPTIERPKLATPHDVLIISARCWQDDAPKVEKMVAQGHANNEMILLFASKAGMPDDLKVDFLVDNGAKTADRLEAPQNALANVLNAWLWTCEYVSALTRHGKYPGVLLSILMPTADANNGPLQKPDGRRFLGDTNTPIPAFSLANTYLKRVDKLMKDLSNKKTQGQLNTASTLIAAQLNAGKKVGLSSCNHVLMWEIYDNRKTPIVPFNVVHRAKTAYAENLKPGDLMVFFGYVGMSTRYEDYLTPLRATGAKFIVCYVKDENAANDAPDAVAHIDQHWKAPDAEVPVPFPPGYIAPVSGLDEVLIYRMLEENVAARLTQK